MPQDAQYTSPHSSHISAGTTNRVPQIRLRAVSPWLAFYSEEITRIDKSRFTFHTGLLKQQMLHAHEFCKHSLRNINVFANHVVISEKAGCLCLINVPARSINHRACRLIPVRRKGKDWWRNETQTKLPETSALQKSRLNGELFSRWCSTK